MIRRRGRRPRKILTRIVVTGGSTDPCEPVYCDTGVSPVPSTSPGRDARVTTVCYLMQHPKIFDRHIARHDRGLFHDGIALIRRHLFYGANGISAIAKSLRGKLVSPQREHCFDAPHALRRLARDDE